MPSTAKVFAGDYILIYQNSATDLKQVISVTNSTSVTVDSNVSSTKAGANLVQILPQNIPVSISGGGRTDRYINLDSTGKILTVSLANTFTTNAAVYVSYNVLVNNSNSFQTKTSNRDTNIALNLTTHPQANSGPWCLGHPDVYRLKKVYLGNAGTVNTNSLDVTSEFYVDHNQNFDFLDLSYLYLNPRSQLSLTTSEGLLVVFDHYTQSNPGATSIESYSINANADVMTLANLSATSTVSLHELSEVYSSQGEYIDLIDAVDFRPRVAVTANITTTSTNITTNPATVNSTSKYIYSGSVLKFPVPDSNFTSDVTHYMGRIDRIVVDKFSQIRDLEGRPGLDKTDLAAPLQPADTITIGQVYIPPYPSIPLQKSFAYNQILDKKISSQKFTYKRDGTHQISVPVNSSTNTAYKQPTRYSMQDIAALDRRITQLEDYVSLNQLEQSVQNLTIPSSINPAINRFKFGFFADSSAMLFAYPLPARHCAERRYRLH